MVRAPLELLARVPVELNDWNPVELVARVLRWLGPSWEFLARAPVELDARTRLNWFVGSSSG